MAALLLGSACGYRWTGASSGPEGAGPRLAIPLMTNHTDENLASEIFTEALRTEAVMRGAFRVTGGQADSVIRGTLRRINWQPVSFGEDGRSRRLMVEAEMEMVWTDSFDRELGRWRDQRSLDYRPGAGGMPLLSESSRLEALRELARLMAAAAYDDLIQGF